MSELQVTWFLLIGILLAGYAILDGFDLGVGFWHLFARKDEERRIFLKAIGPVWDGNEVWLLTAGGALFAAFPPVYASVFSGFYLALVLVLLGLIFRVVSIEFRSQLEDAGWRRRWDLAFCLGSVLPALLFGVALALFGLLVALFPKLLVFIFAAVCITSGIALIQAAFNERRSARDNRDRFDIYSIW